MFRTLLSTTALSVALATAAAAQGSMPDQPAGGASPGAQAPIVPGGGAAPTAEASQPGAGQPGAQEGDTPALANDPAAPAEPPMANQAPVGAGAPAVAGDQPATAQPDVAANEPGRPALDLAGAAPPDLVGSEVRNLDDERIARVEEVITNPEGEVETIIVRFGGFLGLGQSTVALLPDEVEVQREEDDIILRTALSADELRERPVHAN